MSQGIKRQKTVDMSDEPAWGKLVPLTMGIATHEMNLSITVIGRNPGCAVQINDKRLSGKHCQIQKKQNQIILTDLSTNGTYIKDQKIGKGNQVKIQNNQQIWLLPASRVAHTQTLGFKIQLIGPNQEQKEQQKKKQQQKNKRMQEQKAAKSKMDAFSQSLKDQITCSFCFEIMHMPVNVQPCNHKFCGACLTQLVKAKKGDCIQCRKPITTAARDSSFNSIIDDYLKNNPQQKRDPDDIEAMNKKNIFGYDPTDIAAMISGKPIKKKADPAPAVSRGRGRRTLVRASSDLSASDDDQARCRECMNQRNGFKCGAGQKHVKCMNCGKLIADRDDPKLNQKCVLCTNFYCNLYYPPCKKTGVKLKIIRDYKGQSKIDPDLLRGNKYQFQDLKQFLKSKKMTSKQVFDFVIKKMDKKQFSYIVDRKIMAIPPLVSRQVKMNPDDAVCTTCWKDLWFQMVFFYRNQIHAELPAKVRDKPTCYWGINCRTIYKDHHAQQYNHMVYQTRF